MTESPIVTQKRKELESLVNFNSYLGMRNRRTPVEIKIEFHNTRFDKSAGFAMMDKPSTSMSAIVGAVIKETEKQIIRLNREIREYEKADRTRGIDSLGTLDHSDRKES